MSILTWQRKKLFRDFSWLNQQLVATSRWRRLVGGHGTLAQANIWYISSFKNRRGSWGQTSCVPPGSKGNRKRKRKHTHVKRKGGNEPKGRRRMSFTCSTWKRCALNHNTFCHLDCAPHYTDRDALLSRYRLVSPQILEDVQKWGAKKHSHQETVA